MNQEALMKISRGVVELISEEELVKKLATKKPLRIKAGFDPTTPDLHLGHTVVMQKLRQFQELGHKVIFLIGDFTARIGDPSGRDETRPMLSEENIRTNAETYITQAAKVIDMDRAEVRFNSEWLGKMSVIEFAALGAKQTVARMLERDDFKKRMREGHDISVLEFYYPLMQAQDSVELQADVELGGTDQIFNLLMGRTIQKRSGQEPQVVLTMPLLVGTDGVQKMSKTYGNAIGIQESPGEIFGKLMSISDELMWNYYELLSECSLDEIKKMQESVTRESLHPKEAKKQLALEITSRFHGKDAAEEAAQEFEKVFASKQLPSEIECVKLKASKNAYLLTKLIAEQGLAKSNSEARRLIEQGGIRLNEKRVEDPQFQIEQKGDYLIQVGKRRFKKIAFVS